MTRTLDWLDSKTENSDRSQFVDQLRQADDHARAIFALGSPLAVGDESDRVIDATRVLVCGAGNLDDMDGDINDGQYNHDAVTGECLFVSIEAAYRLGITVGLRLADLADEDVSADKGSAPATPAPSSCTTTDTPDVPRTDVDSVSGVTRDTTAPEVDAVARYFVRRFGTAAVDVAFGVCEESTRFIEIVPRVYGSQAEHTQWWNALEKLNNDLSFKEYDAIESGANGQSLLTMQEGYVFGLAVGRQLRPEDAPRGDDEEELAAFRGVKNAEETGGERPAPSATD